MKEEISDTTLNRAEIQGYLGCNPEFFYRSRKKRGMKLSVVTFRFRNGWRQVRQWHRVTVWPEEILRFFEQNRISKGDLVRVSGYLRTDRWYNDGITCYSTDVIVDSCGLCVPVPAEQNKELSATCRPLSSSVQDAQYANTIIDHIID